MGIKKQNGLLVLLFSTVLIAQAFGARLPSSFNLPQSVSYAISHAPSLDQIKKSLLISKLDEKNAVASFLPSVDLKGSMMSASQSNSSSTQGSQLGVSVTQPILNHGDNVTNYHISRQKKRYNLLNFQQARDQLINVIVIDFYNYSLQRQLYQVQKKMLALYATQYAHAQQLYKNGLGTQTDELQFYNEVTSARIQLVEGEQQIRQARTTLINDMGIPISNALYTKIQFKLIKPRASIKKQLFSPIHYQQFYQYKLIQLQSMINSLNVNLKKHQYYPQVDVTAGYNYGNPTYVNHPFSHSMQSNLYANLNVSYNIFDGGTRRRNMIIEEEQGLQSIDQLKMSLLLDKKKLDDLLQDINVQTVSKEINLRLIVSSKHNVVLTTQQYHNGNLKYLDLITALSNLSEAKMAFYNSAYKLAQDRYTYHYYKGDLYGYVFIKK